MEQIHLLNQSHPVETPLFQNRANKKPSQNKPQSSISDCESGVTGSPSYSSSSSSSSHIFPQHLMVKLSKEDRVYDVIQRRFLSCIGSSKGDNTTIVSIHRKNWLNVSGQAKLQSFQLHSRASNEKNGGQTNVKFAWYGNVKECIEKIVEYGFGVFDVLKNNNNHGAVFLSPDHSPATCLEESIEDEDGLRHIMLCRVIMGRPELVQLGSGQTHPSSNEFDSGVDNLENPNKYIIWSSNMNTHILPEYVISFRVSNPKPSISKQESNLRMPRSPWMSFPSLISVLAKYLPHNAICLINKSNKDYKDRKITRRDLIQRIRQIAGDKLLISIIKSCRGDKDLKSSMDFLWKRNSN